MLGFLKGHIAAVWRASLVVGDEYLQALPVDHKNVTVDIPFSFPVGNQLTDVATFESGVARSKWP